MIPAHFLDTKPTTFSILFKGRNNSSIKKEDVHTLILGTIKPMHRVCLPAPESVIIVEVIGVLFSNSQSTFTLLHFCDSPRHFAD